MAERNQHGLGRTIPSDVKREVRKRCGFGCVRCGIALYDYEHFDPDFKDATEHKVDGITLLCMQCNQKRARGTLSVETVRAANENPKCLQQGFSSESFDFGVDPVEVAFAGVTFTGCRTLIEVNDCPLLSIDAPQEQGQPFRMSGWFADENGEITLSIKDNVWSVGADNWDVECVGPRITIRKGKGDISLVLRQEPPKRMVVEQLNMQFEGVYLRGTTDVLETSFNGKNWSKFSSVSMSNCAVGMAFKNSKD
ncbi:hypothetical protein [Paraburkholderia aspalathi]|uniref:hypothetical protein n=1 Tax=Paraburkholderia aspalathi TaxID=1324617 RepID=UPI0038BBC14F